MVGCEGGDDEEEKESLVESKVGLTSPPLLLLLFARKWNQDGGREFSTESSNKAWISASRESKDGWAEKGIGDETRNSKESKVESSKEPTE